MPPLPLNHLHDGYLYFVIIGSFNYQFFMSESLTEVHSLKQLVDKGLRRIGSNMRRSLLLIK